MDGDTMGFELWWIYRAYICRAEMGIGIGMGMETEIGLDLSQYSGITNIIFSSSVTSLGRNLIVQAI